MITYEINLGILKINKNDLYSGGDLSWDSGCTFLQNSSEPSQDLWEATL